MVALLNSYFNNHKKVQNLHPLRKFFNEISIERKIAIIAFQYHLQYSPSPCIIAHTT